MGAGRRNDRRSGERGARRGGGGGAGCLQDHAGFTRRGKAGAVQADTDGYVGAAFTHRTSRAGDPQLHTHVLIANKVRACSDGRWLTLDGR